MATYLPTSRANRLWRIELYDLICITTAPWLAFALRDSRFFEPRLVSDAIIYSGISLVVGVNMLIWSGIGNIISRCFSATDSYYILRTSFMSATVTTLAAFFITRLDAIPRSLPLIHFFVLGSFLIVGRVARAELNKPEKIHHQKFQSKQENIIVVGANHIASFYIHMMDRLGGKKVLAIIDPNPRLLNRTLVGRRVIGAPCDLPHILREYKVHGIEIDKLVVAIDRPELSQTAWECLHSEISSSHRMAIEFLAERLGYEVSSARRVDAARQPEKNSIADNSPRNQVYWKLKRIIDVIVAAFLLMILSPVLVTVALGVRVAIGSPVVFWQRRIGRAGAGVFLFKFRTLLAPFDAQGRWRIESERLPPLGRFLRRTRLDELPQLYNVLRGEMSLIGPRPLLQVDQPLDVGSRLLVRPGITGWAQVHGGNVISPDEKKALDEYYIRNASFWLDLKILIKTALFLFAGDRFHALAIEQALGSSPFCSCRLNFKAGEGSTSC